jgi:hypothetical protein
MEIRKGIRMRIKTSTLAISLLTACFVVAGAAGIARAADTWFVLAEKPIKTADQGVEIKSEGGRWTKDVKKTKLSVEGADVEIVKVILNWDNRGDDTITDIGVLKAGGESLAKDAPGRKGRLKGATVQYKILGDAPTATIKLWGYD